MLHKNWGWLLWAAIALVDAPCLLGAEALLDSPEQKVLNRFVGAWHTNYRLPRSDWSPAEQSGTAELMADRAVGGRFIQEKSEHSDKTSGTTLLTYDDDRRCYRSWWFSSTGKMSESMGQWDAGTRTMLWTSLKDDLTSTTRQWSVAVKDGRGKVVFRIEGSSVRTPAASQVKAAR
jgi:hypothetical protein